jgi:hypothetical protein
MYGALSVAEALVTRDDAEAAAMRSRISAVMRVEQVAGPDSHRFDIVAARARVRAAQWRGLRAPAEVEALARQAPPQ